MAELAWQEITFSPHDGEGSMLRKTRKIDFYIRVDIVTNEPLKNIKLLETSYCVSIHEEGRESDATY